MKAKLIIHVLLLTAGCIFFTAVICVVTLETNQNFTRIKRRELWNLLQENKFLRSEQRGLIEKLESIFRRGFYRVGTKETMVGEQGYNDFEKVEQIIQCLRRTASKPNTPVSAPCDPTDFLEQSRKVEVVIGSKMPLKFQCTLILSLIFIGFVTITCTHGSCI